MATLAPAHLEQALAFVARIGLEVRETRLWHTTFLPGLRIDGGQLLFDRRKLLYPGDVLHEAGHLAVTPAAERRYLGGNITEGHPEREGDEMAVLAWSYAACRACGLPPEVVFHSAGYKGQSDWLLTHFATTPAPIGLPLLVWMGFTTNELFPEMAGWLRA